MTDFLRVNQLPVAVLVTDANGDVIEGGTTDRAQDYTLRLERRAIKNKWSFKLAHLKPTDALAWRDLLLGRGHHWSFETFYSSKGLPVAGGAIDNTHVKFGSHSLKVSSGASATVTGGLKGTDAGYGFLVSYWRRSTGTSFDHWLHTVEGSVYVNGVLSGPAGGPPAHKWVTIASSGLISCRVLMRIWAR